LESGAERLQARPNDSRKSGGIFDIEGKRGALSSLDLRMADPSFWSNQEEAQRTLQQVKSLRAWVDPYEKLESRLATAKELHELLTDSSDTGMEKELDEMIEGLDSEIDSFEVKTLMRGEDDFRDAQVEIAAGAGGTEAQDWAQMLLRMYTRWAERRGFEIELLDESEGEEAGIKGAVVEIRGQYAYGFLHAETGVHRLVRISPFDSASRRHTSFASVFVYPVVNEEINIDIRDEDLKIDVYRASGAGGQHVNKTSSAVRITHLPTNTVVASQQQRSQFKNKAQAMKMLKNKLYQAEVERREREKAELDSTKADVSFGSQIRSYVFQPYTMVNDHRTELKIPDVQKVMDGAIDPFITAYLKLSGNGVGSGNGAK
jgi:peptide chain release factor 2